MLISKGVAGPFAVSTRTDWELRHASGRHVIESVIISFIRVRRVWRTAAGIVSRAKPMRL